MAGGARAGRRTAAKAPIIESVDVSGLPRDSLSPGLRRELDTLTGEPLNRQRLTEMAARIEGRTSRRRRGRPLRRAARRPGPRHLPRRPHQRRRQPRSRTSTRATPSRASRSRAFPKPTSASSLRDRLQALVGRRLDHDEADELSDLLEAERPGYDVDRRISRGSERGRIRVVFEFSEKEGTRWIPFTPSRSKFVYHSEQGWSGALDIPMGGRNHRVTAGFAFEQQRRPHRGVLGRPRRVSKAGSWPPTGSARASRSSRFNDTWRDPTLLALAADPTIPEPYRTRLTVEPSVTFALDALRARDRRGQHVGAGIADRARRSRRMANAVVTRVDYDQRWYQTGDVTQRVEASYELRTSAEALESDLSYRRHLGKAALSVLAAAQHGDCRRRRSAASPATRRSSSDSRSAIRRRCAAGTSTTSRRPAAIACSTARSSIATTASALFLDSGSVWNRNAEMRFRLSTGFGVQTRQRLRDARVSAERR